MANIQVEINEKYGEYLDLIKEILVDQEGNEITDNNKAVEILLESFVAFLQEQAEHAHDHEGHVHGPDCNH